MSKPIILFDAEPFCFGPISTLLSVVNPLRCRLEDSFELVLLGSRTTTQLARRSGLFDRIVTCDTTRLKDLEHHRDLLDQSTAFVVNTNGCSVRWASRSHRDKTVFMDTLFWMWDELPVTADHCVLYLIQDFFGVRERVKKAKAWLPDAHVMGPWITSQAERDASAIPDRPFILVNLGGIEAAGVPTLSLSDRLLLGIAREPCFRKFAFVVAGGGRTIARLREKYLNACNPHIVAVNCFSKERFSALIDACDLMMTSSGLTSFYEACLREKKVMFLPPQNYSQTLQIRAYQKAFADVSVLSWDEMYEDLRVGEDLPEHEGIARTQSCVRRFIDDGPSLNYASRRMLDFLNHPSPVALKNVFGAGSDEAADRIADFVCQRTQVQRRHSGQFRN